MAEKIKIGGELDPRTPEKILGDASTIKDRTWETNHGDVVQTPNQKQDEINEYLQDQIDNIVATEQGGIQTDAAPTEGSVKLVQSGGTYTAIQKVSEIAKDNLISISQKLYLEPSSVEEGKQVNFDGTITDNVNFSYRIYSVEPNKNYVFSGYFSSGISVGFPFIVWFDSDNNFIQKDSHVATGENLHYVNEVLNVPENASYAYMNIQNTLSQYFSLTELNRISSDTTVRSRGGLPDGTDLNTVFTCGVWVIVESYHYLNLPDSHNIGFLRVSNTDGNWVLQEFFPFTGVGYYKRRGGVSTGVFESWVNEVDVKKSDIENSNIRAGLTPGRISERTLLSPTSTESGKFITNIGTIGTNAGFSYSVYSVEHSKLYAFDGLFSLAGIPFIIWFDNNNNFISYESPLGSEVNQKEWKYQFVYPPKNAAYAYANIQNAFSDKFAFYEIKLLDLYSDALISKKVLPSGNLNDVKKNGIYLLASPNTYQNAPNNAQYGFLRIQNANDDWGFQEYWPLNGDFYWTRRWNSSGFLSWTKIGDLTKVNQTLLEHQNELADLNFAVSERELITFDSVVTDKYITTNGAEGSSLVMNYKIYSVSPGDIIACKEKASSGVSYYVFNWYDSNNQFISQNDNITDFDGYKTGIAPSGAAYVYINEYKPYPISVYKLLDIVDNIPSVEEIPSLIQAVSDVEKLTPDSTTTGAFIGDDGIERSNQYFSYSTYSVIGDKYYTFSGEFGSSVGIYFLLWFDENGNYLTHTDEKGPSIRYTNQLVKAPSNAAYAKLNIQNSYSGYFDLTILTNKISSKELKDEIEALENRVGLTKIVINSLYEPVSTTWNNHIAVDRFHIRSKYNSEKDILIRHYYNGNGLISFLDTYVGPNSLTDAELATNQYLVSTHSDSTAPLFMATQYWHLFAQHGYPVPVINNPGLTSSDIGATWRDDVLIDDGGGNSHYRQYVIGRVTNNKIWLLPVIYQVDGHDVRDWKDTPYSAAITTLIHVSGGSYSSQITVSGYSQDQLRPIMTGFDRKFVIDGTEITNTGTYFGKEVKISESAIGYDPASISNEDWFSNTGDNVDPSDGNPMCKFTFSYNYIGAQCCVNTTIQFLKEIECQGYGAIQQQFFYDTGDYKAMFMIPKAKTQGGVDIDVPFNSKDSSATSYGIYRTSTDLKDVNNPVDRQIGYLYNPNTQQYLVGMAAGLSLVSGDTITSKRIINCIEGNSGPNYCLLTFSPSNINKFYVRAINTAKYTGGFFPVGLFKEINYYVSYFDPAENVGQVYWYKDGGKYVIYCHCQTQETTLAINVPECMEGLSLSIVEKTDDTELLTDVIANGKFFVNYNTADANYIVLEAK